MPLSLTLPEPAAGILAKTANAQLGLTRSASCDRASAQLLTSSPAASLFPQAPHPEAAVSGLLLLLGCWDESHNVSQDISSREGSYWHGIAHRIEPDSANAGYWFRRVGDHPIFPHLHSRAVEILDSEPGLPWRLKSAWDPFLFIQWCDEARLATGSIKERAALQMQTAEWELLFHWCAGPAVAGAPSQ